MLNDLFNDYPVMLSKEDVTNYLDLKPDSTLLRTAHEIVYDFLIYPTFNADIKNRIITKYIDKLEKPIGRALLAQYEYLYANGGDVSLWNGIMRSANGMEQTELQEVLTKVICPRVINILKGAPIDLLYAGG